MAKGGYEIRPLQQSDCAVLPALMMNCFGMEVTAAYFNWKYFQNPAGPCVGFIAIEKNTQSAVSFYGAIPQPYIVNGRAQIIYQACDTMTHTEHRKKGLYPVLAKETYELLKSRNAFFMIGIGGTDQSFPVLRHFGWRNLFRFRNYFKPSLFCKFFFLRSFNSAKFKEESSVAAIAALIAARKPTATIYSPGDIAHYQWRIENPKYKYQLVTFRSKDEPEGFINYYVQGDKLFLFDFYFSSTLSRKALLWYLSKKAAKGKYRGVISFCMEGGAQSRQLKKSNFISNPFNKGPLANKAPFLIFSDEETMNKYADPGHWFITAYDYDAS